MVLPEPGDFGLVSIEGGVGKLIRFGQWLNGDGFTNYEHAFIYVGNGKIVEAEPGGALISELAKYDGRPVLWSTGIVNLSHIQRNSIITRAILQEGIPYSFLDYLAIALYRLGIKYPRVAKRVEDSDHLICSQLVALDYSEVGSPLTEYPPYLVTPGRLAEYLISFRHKRKLSKLVQQTV